MLILEPRQCNYMTVLLTYNHVATTIFDTSGGRNMFARQRLQYIMIDSSDYKAFGNLKPGLATTRVGVLTQAVIYLVA